MTVITDLIEEARMRERERCAKLLDDRAQHFNRLRDPGMASHCRSLAREIRTPPTVVERGGRDLSQAE